MFRHHWDNKEAHCRTAVPADQDHGNESLRCDKGFRKCCISTETDGREDEDEVENVGREYESDWEKEDANRKALKLRKTTGMVNSTRLVKPNKGQ
jgi:hypothetical protein